MPEKWKAAIPAPKSTTKNSLEDSEKSTNKQMNTNNPTSKSAVPGSIPVSISGSGHNLKKPSIKKKKREKLDTTLLRLLSLLPNAKNPLDASNLLESTESGQKRPKRCSRVGQKYENTEKPS